jgi:hypothetical protein
VNLYGVELADRVTALALIIDLIGEAGNAALFVASIIEDLGRHQLVIRVSC